MFNEPRTLRTFEENYAEEIRLAREYMSRKRAREDEIERDVRNEYSGHKAVLPNGGIPLIVSARCAKDDVAKDLQTNVERHIALATAYGIGAMLKRLAVIEAQVQTR